MSLPPSRAISQSRDSHRWTVFGVIATVYFFVYFHRVSPSVIAPDLLEAFQAHATGLGIMSSMYFYTYAFEQPLVGHLSDAIGARRVVGLWSLVAALGCVIFGLAPTMGWAAVGRGLIGFGVGGVYVPALQAFSQWFKEKEFATMTGFLLAAGNLGAIVATTPLAWMARAWGWRLGFLVIGGITFVLAVATLLLLRDHGGASPGASAGPPGQGEKPGGSTRHVLGSMRFWVLAAIFFGVLGSFLTFQGLWATPSLMSALRLDQLRASQLNMLVPVGFIIGAPVVGWLADRVFRNKIRVFIGMLGMLTGIWFYLALGVEAAGEKVAVVALLVLGASTGGFASTLWSLVRETTPPRILGLTSGLLNPAPFFGVALLQGITGAILDRTGRVGGMYPPEAFRNAFLLCAIIVATCFVLSACFRKVLGR